MANDGLNGTGRFYAHSVPGRPVEEWELLRDHLHAVAERSAEFGADFGFAEVARLAGALHDIGKGSEAFQRYIGESADEEERRGKRIDHSTAGAREALGLLDPQLGRLVAFAVAGHHAGLADGVDLATRLDKVLEPYGDWRAHAGPIPTMAALAPTRRFRQSAEPGFTYAFLTRMLFSCLVDADRLETAQFYGAAAEEPATALAVLRDRLAASMAEKAASARAKARSDRESALNAFRAAILDHALAKASLPPGLFTLTVPTGGGKTLASLSFALDHAVRHGLRRVVYVIPFTGARIETSSSSRASAG